MEINQKLLQKFRSFSQHFKKSKKIKTGLRACFFLFLFFSMTKIVTNLCLNLKKQWIEQGVHYGKEQNYSSYLF